MTKQRLTIAALITILQGMTNQEDIVTLYNPEDGSFNPMNAEDVSTITVDKYIGGTEDEEVIAKNILVAEPGDSIRISVLCLNSRSIDTLEAVPSSIGGETDITHEVHPLMTSLDELSQIIHYLPPTAGGHTIQCAPGLSAFTKNKAAIIDALTHAQRGMYGLLEVIAVDKQQEVEYQEHVAEQQLKEQAEAN